MNYTSKDYEPIAQYIIDNWRFATKVVIQEKLKGYEQVVQYLLKNWNKREETIIPEELTQYLNYEMPGPLVLNQLIAHDSADFSASLIASCIYKDIQRSFSNIPSRKLCLGCNEFSYQINVSAQNFMYVFLKISPKPEKYILSRGWIESDFHHLPEGFKTSPWEEMIERVEELEQIISKTDDDFKTRITIAKLTGLVKNKD